MRAWMIGGSVAGAGLLLGLLVAPTLLSARAAGKADNPEEPPARPTQLPIGRVVLFSSGVGYFQREGQIEGDARVDLIFPVSDINDLIKSMVLRDHDGGHISTVSYDSNAPVERTLKSFAVNLTGNPGFTDILTQARGERIEVSLSNAGSGALSGTIIGVEKQKVAVDNGRQTVDQAVLNLWCSDGMRSVKVAEIQRVRFLNPTLDSEFKKALETLALSHDVAKKAMSIRCVGEGKRKVTVGYVIENPIWKTSYRLVLGSKPAEKPYLQGWAVVENPSDEDWKDVRMALVSGRPISFQMDLYQPLYVNRPFEKLELFEDLRSVAYDGALENGLRDGNQSTQDSLNVLGSQVIKRSLAGKSVHGLGGGLGGGLGVRLGDERGSRDYRKQTEQELAQGLNLGGSVASAATATKLGDFFQYAIDRPVTLPRQKSALLPIVGKDVEASRVSIYNERVQAKFPLLGLKVKNTSGLHLMQGPITVFEGSNYAGDARIQDLQPNEERLVSYAIDLGTEVNPAPALSNGRITHVKAVKGIIETTTRIREARLYTIKNRNEAERTLLIEHPRRHEFSLVDAKPNEITADVYRFELKVPAGASKTFPITEERQIASSFALINASDEQIRILSNEPVMSDKVKAGLKQAQDLRWALQKTQREIGEQQRQLNTIVQDQERLRANLKEMPSTAQAYKRYLEKFDKQETQIEKYQEDIKTLQATEHTQKKSFDDFLVAFSAE